MAQRMTHRRRKTYNTRSNKTRVVKTPGGKNTLQYVKKRGKVARCGDTGVPLKGVCHLTLIKAGRPRELARMSKRMKTVSRIYGGMLSAEAVRARVMRAFLAEETRLMKKHLRAAPKQVGRTIDD